MRPITLLLSLSLSLAAPAAAGQVLPGDLLFNVWAGPVDLLHTRPDGTPVASYSSATSPGHCEGVAITPGGELLTGRRDVDGFSLFDPAGNETAHDSSLLTGVGDTAVLSNGELLVVDQSGRIEVFAPDGTHLRTIGLTQLSHPWGLHVDLEDTLWVSDIGLGEIQRFAADGTQLLALAVGYDPADLVRAPDGTLWTIGDKDGRLRQHAPDGTLLNSFPTVMGDNSSGIALEPDGTLLVSQWTAPQFHRYGQDGTWIETIPVPEAIPGGLLFMTVAEGSLGNIGDRYCGPANLNSSGLPAQIGATGSTKTIFNLVVLHATQLPPGEFGYFLNSMTQDFVPFPPGSLGSLCLGGAIGRYRADVASSGPAGELHLKLDLTDTPTPSGPVAVQPGETWNFQCWFRDQHPGPTSNFTDGVSIVFD